MCVCVRARVCVCVCARARVRKNSHSGEVQCTRVRAKRCKCCKHTKRGLDMDWSVSVSHRNDAVMGNVNQLHKVLCCA
jgi:hypothetical protein